MISASLLLVAAVSAICGVGLGVVAGARCGRSVGMRQAVRALWNVSGSQRAEQLLAALSEEEGAE